MRRRVLVVLGIVVALLVAVVGGAVWPWSHPFSAVLWAERPERLLELLRARLAEPPGPTPAVEAVAGPAGEETP